MLTAIDVQKEIKKVAIDAMHLLFRGLDKQIGDFMSGQSNALAITPELLIWYARFLSVSLAEKEMVGDVDAAQEAAYKLPHMFRAIDGSANVANESPEAMDGYEMLQKAKDEIIDFLASRPTVNQIADQTYGGSIPKNIIELHASIR